MGSIVSSLPTVPADADPSRLRLYGYVYNEFGVLNITAPVQTSDVITQAQLIAFLQAVIGLIIKDEIINDPKGFDYASKTDEQIKDTLLAPEVPIILNPTANVAGYEVKNPYTSTDVVIDLEKPGGAVAGLNGVTNLATSFLFFTAIASPIQIRCTFHASNDSGDNDTLGLNTAIGVDVAAGEPCFITSSVSRKLRPRYVTLMANLPYAPVVITTTDVTQAQT